MFDKERGALWVVGEAGQFDGAGVDERLLAPPLRRRVARGENPFYDAAIKPVGSATGEPCSSKRPVSGPSPIIAA